MKTQEGLLKPTLQITVLTIFGVLVSFITQIIVAKKFGAAMEIDTYFAASVVPDYIAVVFLGSLTVIFVPIFIEYGTKKSQKDAWKIASIFTNLTTLVLFGISLVGFIFAKRIILVTAPGFKGAELSLTATLLRILLPSLIFGGLTSLLTSIYYAEHRFLQPAIAPVLSAVLMLLSVVLLARYWGVKSLAFGRLIGTVVGLLVVIPILFKQERYHFSLDFTNEGVIQVVKVMSPLVFAALFYRSTTVIERMIASTLPTGSIAYLGYANRIIAILGTIATAGISTTIFPVMSKSWAENDLAKVREYFAKGVRIIMLTTFPIATIITVLRVPIIQVLFERGAFDHKATIAVANVLAILMVVFITSGLGNVVGKGFYISQKTKLCAVLGIVEILAYISAAYFLSKTFSYVGLAIASSIQFTFGLIVSMYCMKKIYNGVNGKKIFVGFVKISLASFISAGFVYCSFHIATLINLSLILKTCIAGFLGLLTFALVSLYVLKLEEALSIQQKMIGRFRVSIIPYKVREF